MLFLWLSGRTWGSYQHCMHERTGNGNGTMELEADLGGWVLCWSLGSCSGKKFLSSKLDTLRTILYLNFGLGNFRPLEFPQTRHYLPQVQISPHTPCSTPSLSSNPTCTWRERGEKRCVLWPDPLSGRPAALWSVYFTLFSGVLEMFKWLGKLGHLKVMVFCIIWFLKIFTWPFSWGW